MKLVIDIDENLYTRLFDNGGNNVMDMRRACVAIRKGTPLPKGHGRLVDERQVVTALVHCDFLKDNVKCGDITKILDIAKIIEADIESGG